MLAPDRAVRIRPSTPRDQPAIASVIRRSWIAAYQHVFGPRLIAESFAGRVRFFLAWTQQRSAELGGWVASINGEVVGSAGLHLRKDGEAELSHLYVLPERQGAGAGSALLGACCGVLRTRGCQGLRIWVLERTPAVEFYQKHHAEEIGRAVTLVGRQAEATLCMRIALSKDAGLPEDAADPVGGLHLRPSRRPPDFE